MDLGTPSLNVVVVAEPGTGSHLRELLDAAPGVTVIDVVGADALADTVAHGAPDVVVLADGQPGLDAAASIAPRATATRFVAVADGATTPEALVAGAVGAVVAGAAVDDELVAAVRGLALGEAVVDAALAAHVLARYRAADAPRDLSPTEEEVLTRLAAGDSVATLADDYAVTPRLVRLHVGGALSRLLAG